MRHSGRHRRHIDADQIVGDDLHVDFCIEPPM